MSKSGYLTADLDYLLRNVDWERIRLSIEKTEGWDALTLPDQEETLELVWLAAESWLSRDLQEFESIIVEERLLDGHAYIDLQGVMRGTMAPYDKFPGYIEVIDFKTTRAPVHTEAWRQKCLSSWQAKWYAALKPEARYFVYRGISRERVVKTEGENNWEEAPRVREVRVELNEFMGKEVEIQKAGVMAEYNALLASDLPLWPRNTHTGCYAWGMKCPHKDTCDTNQMPLGTTGMEPLTELSFSRMSTIMLCKERARRNKLNEIAEVDGDSSDASIIGTCAHAGFASLWEEAFRTR